jgi:hypothetical protein
MMAPFKHVTDVEVLARYFVELTFDGEERRVVDLEPLLEGPAFEHLKQDYELFCAVRADEDAQRSSGQTVRTCPRGRSTHTAGPAFPPQHGPE